MPDHDIAKDHLKRFAAMQSARSLLDGHLQDIRDHIRPISGSFTGAEAAGAKTRGAILDSSGEDASDLLSSSVHGYLTNPGTTFFGIRTKDPDLMRGNQVQAWFERAVKIMMFGFEDFETGFMSDIGQVYGEDADFGTTCMYIADRPGKLPLYQAQSLTDYWIDQDDEGVVDTVYRRFQLSARNAVARWGDKAGEKVVKAAKSDKLDTTFTFLHAVTPRNNGRTGLLASGEMPFASHWISVEDKTLIAEGGYQDMPYIVGRWAKRSGELYGRGPGMKALADDKMLQRAMTVTIRGVEKQVDPGLMVFDDGVVGAIRSGSNSITTIRRDLLTGRQSPIQSMPFGGAPDVGEAFMVSIRERIERAYFNHLLRQLRDPRMTATQVLEIKEETLKILGPFLGRIQNELLGPIIMRTFGIYFRAGYFPPPPDVLRGERIEVEYVSPIARARKLSEARAVSQLYDVIAPISDRNPEVLDRIDDDAAVLAVADSLGTPRSIIRDDDTVAAIRDARNAAKEQAQQTETLERLAAAAQSGGQAVASVANIGGAP